MSAPKLITIVFFGNKPIIKIKFAKAEAVEKRIKLTLPDFTFKKYSVITSTDEVINSSKELEKELTKYSKDNKSDFFSIKIESPEESKMSSILISNISQIEDVKYLVKNESNLNATIVEGVETLVRISISNDGDVPIDDSMEFILNPNQSQGICNSSQSGKIIDPANIKGDITNIDFFFKQNKLGEYKATYYPSYLGNYPNEKAVPLTFYIKVISKEGGTDSKNAIAEGEGILYKISQKECKYPPDYLSKSIRHIRVFNPEFEGVSDLTLRNALIDSDLNIDNALKMLID
jgi:hypothetical protein